MSELNKVRDYMLALGRTTRSQPVDSLSPLEKTAMLELIIDEVWSLAYASGISISPKPLMVVHNPKGPQDVNPETSLLALSGLLHATFHAYHTLGLPNCASVAFKEYHASLMSELENDDGPFFTPDMHSIVKSNQVSRFLDPDDAN